MEDRTRPRWPRPRTAARMLPADGETRNGSTFRSQHGECPRFEQPRLGLGATPRPRTDDPRLPEKLLFKADTARACSAARGHRWHRQLPGPLPAGQPRSPPLLGRRQPGQPGSGRGGSPGCAPRWHSNVAALSAWASESACSFECHRPSRVPEALAGRPAPHTPPGARVQVLPVHQQQLRLGRWNSESGGTLLSDQKVPPQFESHRPRILGVRRPTQGLAHEDPLGAPIHVLGGRKRQK